MKKSKIKENSWILTNNNKVNPIQGNFWTSTNNSEINQGQEEIAIDKKSDEYIENQRNDSQNNSQR